MSEFDAPGSEMPLAPVAPADLKRVWNAIRDLAASPRTPGVGFDVRIIRRECEAGSDPLATFFRASLIRMLLDKGVLDNHRDEDQPDDTVFESMAEFPMENGVRGLDLAALIARLKT